MTIRFTALPSDAVSALRTGGLDAYGEPVERHISDGDAYPCRHCLGAVAAGREYLILAHRPFDTRNPYAETGPIFLCADPCQRAPDSPTAPAILKSPSYILRGYTAQERILYGTGSVVATGDLAHAAKRLLANPDIAFCDVRSAANNCFQCRILRA